MARRSDFGKDQLSNQLRCHLANRIRDSSKMKADSELQFVDNDAVTKESLLIGRQGRLPDILYSSSM